MFKKELAHVVDNVTSSNDLASLQAHYFFGQTITTGEQIGYPLKLEDIETITDVTAAMKIVNQYFVVHEPSSPSRIILNYATYLMDKPFNEVMRAVLPEPAKVASIKLTKNLPFVLWIDYISEFLLSQKIPGEEILAQAMPPVIPKPVVMPAQVIPNPIIEKPVTQKPLTAAELFAAIDKEEAEQEARQAELDKVKARTRTKASGIRPGRTRTRTKANGIRPGRTRTRTRPNCH